MKSSEGGGSCGFSLLTYTGSAAVADVPNDDPGSICNVVVKLWSTLDLPAKTLNRFSLMSLLFPMKA